MIRNALLALAVLASVLCFGQGETGRPSAQPAQSAASTNSLFREITQMDGRLFDAIFKECDVGSLTNLLAEDFEFYHDRGGLIATNRAQFVEVIRKTCERQESGQEVRSRRELVSMEVFPLTGYGAVQTGVHRFFIIRDNQAEEPGDIAQFTHVWKKTRSGWRIARVLSYDHKLQPK